MIEFSMKTLVDHIWDFGLFSHSLLCATLNMPSALLSLVYTKPSCENPCDQRCGILALIY